MSSKAKRYALLFLYTVKISAFTFGGGYVIVSLMKKQFVDKLHWLTEEEMLDYTAIAQSSPGAVAVNAAILVGYKIGGILGMAVAVLGTVLPPLTLLTVLSYAYTRFITVKAVQYVLLGMKTGVAAVICDVVCGLTKAVWRESKWMALATAAFSFLLVSFLSVNVIWIVVICGLFGALKYGRRKDPNDPA